MRQLKTSVLNTSRGLPYCVKHFILDYLAKLPPRFRVRVLRNYAAELASSLDETNAFVTNMGISNNYRCQIPNGLDSNAIWGKPEFYKGEWHSLVLLAKLQEYFDVFIDIGSHIGYYVFWMRQHLSKHKSIYYFEPVTEYFDIIEQNVTRNHLPNVEGHPLAVSDQDGIIKFYKNISDSFCGSITNIYVDSMQTVEIEVETIRLSTFIDKLKLDRVCVKVDVEGAESLVFEGMDSVLDRIQFILIEVLDSQSDFLRYISENTEFAVFHVVENNLRYCKNGVDILAKPYWNWLLCRYKPEELQDILVSTNLQVIY